MLINSFLLGGMSVVGFYFIFLKLPNKIKQFFKKKPLLTDGIAALLTYILLGGTATGLFASAWAGIIVSIMIAISHNDYLMKKINESKDILTKFMKQLEIWVPPKQIIGTLS